MAEAKKLAPKGTPGEKQATAANVTPIHAGKGRKSQGYDPATGTTTTPKGYRGATRESAMETDVFTLVDETGYRADRFYTRSVNADGHGEKLSVRVPQGIDSQMHAAVAAVAQYHSLHDLIRDAVVHRLEWIQRSYQLGDGARRMLELQRIEAEMEARTQESQSMSSAVKNLEAKLQGFWDEQDYAMLAEELSKGVELYEWLREPYKSRAVSIITRFKAMGREAIAKMQDDLDKA